MTIDDPLDGWVPLYLQRGHVNWAYMGEERFSDPFCQSTLQRLAARPFNQLFRQRTGLDILTQRASTHPGLPVRGIVFHISRCGSTLVAQTLAALPDSVVLSEPPAFDTLLQWLLASPALPRQAGADLLQGLTAALGQPRRQGDSRLFIKTDCWHICHIDRILGAFPNVPWLFLYRNPVEVLVSQSRLPALYLVPGALIQHGLTPPEQLQTQPLAHGAWVLSHVMQEAARAMRQYPGGLLLNYSELPKAIGTRLNPHFALDLCAADIAAIETVTARDAKNPERQFQADSDEKRASADAALHALAARYLDEPYRVLEGMRLGRD